MVIRNQPVDRNRVLRRKLLQVLEDERVVADLEVVAPFLAHAGHEQAVLSIEREQLADFINDRPAGSLRLTGHPPEQAPVPENAWNSASGGRRDEGRRDGGRRDGGRRDGGRRGGGWRDGGWRDGRRGPDDLAHHDPPQIVQDLNTLPVIRITAETPDGRHVAAAVRMRKMAVEGVQLPIRDGGPELAENRQGHDEVAVDVGMNAVRPHGPPPTFLTQVFVCGIHDAVHVDHANSQLGGFVADRVVSGAARHVERRIPSATGRSAGRNRTWS